MNNLAKMSLGNSKKYMTHREVMGGFGAREPYLRGELFTLATRAADWAENTGGCDPKPIQCLGSL